MSVTNHDLTLRQAQAALSQGQPGQAAARCRQILAIDPFHADAIYFLGLTHAMTGEVEAAIGQWRNVLRVRPRHYAALTNLGTALSQQGRHPEALDVLENAAAPNPAVPELHYALGVARHRAGQLTAAVSAYERFLGLRADAAVGWRDRGRALETLQKLGAALESYQKAAALAPEDPGSHAGILSCSVRTCSWVAATRSLQRLRDIPGGLEGIHPFLALSVCDDPTEQLRISTARCQSVLSSSRMSDAVPRRNAGNGRIRVAYVSSDLRDHAVAYVLAGVLEKHDRDRFEIHAISLQPEARESEIGQRLRNAFEHFHDVSARNDVDVAQLLRDLNIDIAVDLNGYTIGGRPGIFAHRAAPVQVSFLGYGGTLGAPYMDYLLADATVIPHGEESDYRETVVRLPQCYLPNDDRREIGPVPTRSEAGLPEDGVVFCAFTHPYKINAPIYDVWMRLLREVPGSVLWLREMTAEARENLEREAQARGVKAQRLIFAPHTKTMAAHLARQALADLYLDTLPYNAHTTACDALWAGVPVLTCSGNSFASRVAASALKAVGLPELITHDLGQYERLALELAREPRRLEDFRARLAQQRMHAPLFDTAVFCRNLEEAYSTLHERSQTSP
jgi:protein O-GlcNAc transferase